MHFSVFCNYLPHWKKGIAFHLNKFESPSISPRLNCVKFDLNRSSSSGKEDSLISSMNFRILQLCPFEKDFIWTNLNPIHPLASAKNSGGEDENVKNLQVRWTDWQPDGKTHGWQLIRIANLGFQLRWAKYGWNFHCIQYFFIICISSKDIFLTLNNCWIC